MVAVQKIPKGVLIVNDYILDKFQAKIGQQPPEGYRAYSFKTELVDTHHNSVQAGDRVDVVGVFKYRDSAAGETRAPSTFLKNIEVWQVNDKHYIGGNKEQTDKISTITVLLTPEQCEIALLAEDIASTIRFVKTNRQTTASNDPQIDLSSLVALNKNRPENDSAKPSQAVGDTAPAEDMVTPGNSDPLIADSQPTLPVKKPEYKFKMTIYRGGQAVKYGFTDKGSLPKIIEQSAEIEGQQLLVPPVAAVEDLPTTPQEDRTGESH
ncbi:MAG: RcpC/CpaB family pilus assembly protein [Planctomycetota bacterium]|nr:RcpC/CpaB family pilus assembly protein [Planctomycetota bacterium]